MTYKRRCEYRARTSPELKQKKNSGKSRKNPEALISGALDLAGQWVGGKRQLAVLRSLNGMHVKGVVEAADRTRLSRDAEGTFLPEDPSQPKLKVRFTHLADVSIQTLPEEMLADIHGGRVSTLPIDASDNGELLPRQTWFELELAVENPPGNFLPSQVMRGTAVLDGEARSFAYRIFTQVASVLIRESGF